MDISQANCGVRDQMMNVTGDGACFVRAILCAITLKNVSPFVQDVSQCDSDHYTLRMIVVAAVRVDDEFRYPFNLMTSEYSTKQDWLTDMSRPTTWADRTFVQACSDVLEVPIRIMCGRTVLESIGQEYYSKCVITGIDNQIILQLNNGHYTVQVWE